MIRRFTRALVLSTLVLALLAPAAAIAAAPAHDREGGRYEVSLLARAWNWILSISGAGGGNFDPTGRTLTGEPPPENVTESTSASSAIQRCGHDDTGATRRAEGRTSGEDPRRF